ncbi:MAG: hypothetical protein K9G46_05485 [Flavobacteriales bacterium]|nr:hypothetical protein [Flavobacteriales bacterium]
MKTLAVIISSVSILIFITLYSTFPELFQSRQVEREKGCVFNSMMGIETTENYAQFKTPDKVVASIDHALGWMAEAQQKNGGWGAGSHHRQMEMDPHAVQADPATTSMVGMALLRNGNTLESGTYANQLKKAVEYLLKEVENSNPNSLNITNLTGTQIQSKLGQNIDVVLASQFLTNLLEKLPKNDPMRKRINEALNVCVVKIQEGQMADGSTKGAGWAGVLQSSLATNALESAEYAGAKVDTDKLSKAKEYQTGNFDAETGNVNTDRGAGVVLYSVSGSARSAAKDARQVTERMQLAQKQGLIKDAEDVSADNLRKAGFAENEAIKAQTSYKVYESAKRTAQREDVMSGFGNNGGEEFISFLQTGEGLVIAKDNSWRNWYDDISGKMVKIQNQDGSWNGHHCITSPVFCTATCLLILSIENDLQNLQKLGGS